MELRLYAPVISACGFGFDEIFGLSALFTNSSTSSFFIE